MSLKVCYALYLLTTGVPAMVPGVTIDDNTINANVTLTLSWGEPFDYRDPIVNYTVSCSGDDTCPPNFTTTDITARRYTITNLTPMTDYTFSVVATNSFGSGEAGVVMITTPGELINTTTTAATTTSSVDLTNTPSIPTSSMTATTADMGMATSASAGRV